MKHLNLKELPNYVKKIEKDPSKPIEKEWLYLEQHMDDEIEDHSEFFRSSHLNPRKNRYSDVLANEETRVKLPQESDYINANWIEDLWTSQRNYIVTQGPLESTLQDFFSMLWNEKITTVVMLTNEFERGRKKCERYWPSDTKFPLTAGAFQVYLKEENEDFLTKGFIIRHLELVGPNSEVRKIIQFQFVDWPDHGVPACVDNFLNFVDTVDAMKSSGPLVVHCSAGIGRSAVFIVVHSTINSLKNNSNLEVPSFTMANLILKLRKQRHGMIQTFDQYKFCWEALAQQVQKLLKN